jgi:hypothetical protein
MYPGEKLAHLTLGKKIIIVKNATAYTWDWYCHLVVDRASLWQQDFILLNKCSATPSTATVPYLVLVPWAERQQV